MLKMLITRYCLRLLWSLPWRIRDPLSLRWRAFNCARGWDEKWPMAMRLQRKPSAEAMEWAKARARELDLP